MGSIGENDVAEVSRTGHRRYDHVLIAASVENVYLVVVVDLRRRDVMGHHLLDLNREYGLGPDG